MPDITRLREFWTGLGGRGQFTLVGSVVVVLAAAFLLFRFSSQPSYVTVASDMAATDSSAVTKALDGEGIPYKLNATGSEVSVDSSLAARARLALASSNLPRGGQVGFEIFDKRKLGATDFQNQVDYQRALEGEVGRTIEQVEGVQSAEVQLVLPEDTLFADQASKATAAVLLTAGQLDPGTVAGIAHLVSSSVKGLDTRSVTITDSTGSMLWPTGDAGGGTTATSKTRAESLYSDDLSTKINAVLASTLGSGKALARVHANLSLDKTTIDSVKYAKKGTPLQTETDTETLGASGAGTPAVGAGTPANISPTAVAAAGAAGTSTYNHQKSSTVFGVDKTVERTAVAPGSVRKLDVALIVDNSVPAAQVESLKATVASMAGIDATRGDTLAVSRIDFAPPKTDSAPKAGPLSKLDPVSLAKPVLLIFGALGFLLFLRRHLQRREREGVLPEPTWLREIETSMPIAELESPTMMIRPALDPAASERAQELAMLRGELEEVARSNPEQVAMQVSQWMRQ